MAVNRTAKPRRRWRNLAIALVVLVIVLFLLLTGSKPIVTAPRAATASQVVRAKNVFNTITNGRDNGEPVTLSIGQADIDAAAAMVSQGFRPARVAGEFDGSTVRVFASRPLLFRWVNVRVAATGASEGFPDLRVKVGSIPIPQWASHLGLRLVRKLLVWHGAELPPLDEMVPFSRIHDNRLSARLMLPATGLVSQARSFAGVTVEPASVRRIFCRLVAAQEIDPQNLFAAQVRRAISASPATANGHAEALVALAMFTVDPGLSKRLGAGPVEAIDCDWTPPSLLLQGRSDSPMHWSLSAALEVTTGNLFTTAMGEWKELADSIPNPAEPGKNPSGFSFVDIAADRAGFLTAAALTDSARLERKRDQLRNATDADLLPVAALSLSEGMTNQTFVDRYGATDDPRFAAEVAQIDSMLKNAGID